MTGLVFKNNAKTTLSSAVNNSTTTIPVTEGSVFPAGKTLPSVTGIVVVELLTALDSVVLALFLKTSPVTVKSS